MFVGGRVSTQYALNRPSMPLPLITKIMEFAFKGGAIKMAVDIGCGTGLSTRILADNLADATIVGLDCSDTQIVQAKLDTPVGNVLYRTHDVNSHALPYDNGTVQLITCVQSAHWLNLLHIFHESSRVLQNGGVFAIIGYGVPYPRFGEKSDANELLRNCIMELHDYLTENGFWAPQRKIVDNQFQGVQLPFENCQYLREDASLISIKDCSVCGLFDYISTWSGLRLLLHNNPESIVFTDFQKKFLSILPEGTNINDDSMLRIIFPWFLLMGRK